MCWLSQQWSFAPCGSVVQCCAFLFCMISFFCTALLPVLLWFSSQVSWSLLGVVILQKSKPFFYFLKLSFVCNHRVQQKGWESGSWEFVGSLREFVCVLRLGEYSQGEIGEVEIGEYKILGNWLGSSPYGVLGQICYMLSPCFTLPHKGYLPICMEPLTN